MFTKVKMRGRRVTIPVPRGRKLLPTIPSRTLDLPDDWPPTCKQMTSFMTFRIHRISFIQHKTIMRRVCKHIQKHQVHRYGCGCSYSNKRHENVTYHNDLWKVKSGVLSNGTQDILKLRDDRNQLIHLFFFLFLASQSIVFLKFFQTFAVSLLH